MVLTRSKSPALILCVISASVRAVNSLVNNASIFVPIRHYSIARLRTP
jgi:hypothetical protein